MRRILTLFVLAALLELTGASRALAQQISGDITAGASTCAPGDGVCVQLDLNNELWNTIFIGTKGTWSGTNIVEFLPINSSTWATATCVDLLSSNYGGAVTTFTGNKNLICANRIYQAIRVRGTNSHTGTLTIAMRAAAVNGLTGLDFGGGSATIGSVNQGTAGVDPWVVSCSSGCSGGTSDADDASIATGQTTGLALSLNQVFDGTVWRRQTIGVAGTAASQVYTVQGIASMTPFLVTLSGTNNVTNAGTFATQAAQSGTWTVQPGNTANTTAWLFKGGLTHNNAAPGAVNLGVLPALANASAPTYTEGDQVLQSTDLHGSMRVVSYDSSGNAISVGVLDPCQGNAKVYTPISQTAGTQLVTGTSSKKTYVCAITIVAADAENVSLVAGTGTVCATNTVAVIGGTSAAAGPNLAANGGFVLGNGASAVAATTVNADNLCLLQSGSGRVAGVLTSVVQ